MVTNKQQSPNLRMPVESFKNIYILYTEWYVFVYRYISLDHYY